MYPFSSIPSFSDFNTSRLLPNNQPATVNSSPSTQPIDNSKEFVDSSNSTVSDNKNIYYIFNNTNYLVGDGGERNRLLSESGSGLSSSEGRSDAFGEDYVYISKSSQARMEIDVLKETLDMFFRPIIHVARGSKNTAFIEYVESELKRANLGEIESFAPSGAILSENGKDQQNQIKWLHTLQGVGESTKKLIAATGVATALPAVGQLLSFGFGGVPGACVQATAYLAAMYLGMHAAKSLPADMSYETFKAWVDDAIGKLTPIGERVENLEHQETLRKTFGSRMDLTTAERNKSIELLKVEIKELEKGCVSTDRNIAVGSGDWREKIMAIASTVQAAFNHLRTSIEILFKNIALRREENKASEAAKTYEEKYKGPLTLLATIEPKDLFVRRNETCKVMEKSGYSTELQNSRFEAVQKALTMGSNLANILKSTPRKIAFGYAEVGRVVAPASLTLARALSWFVFQQDTQQENGPFSVPDPDGQLYNFLLCVPSAYTSTMAEASDNQDRLATWTINDFSDGFPQGARSMQFEKALNAQTNKQELRVKFLKDVPPLVFGPLMNECQALGKVFVETPREELHVDQERALDDTPQPVEQSNPRVAELKAQLAMLEKLQRSDVADVKRLQDWVEPEFMRGSRPIWA